MLRPVSTPWLRTLLLLIAVLTATFTAGTQAQGLESALSPGKMSSAHAKWEDDCSACHVRFDRAGQDRLCADCHKDVRQDMRQHTGYHGRLQPQACRSCHTEHKGRDGRIVALDPKRFDHAQTDYALKGAHKKVECDDCHRAGRKHREAPTECNACHRQDDVHKGSLGAACADCHTEASWKEARFDHDKTRFALTGRHVQTECTDCHKTRGDYKNAPRTCIGCHRKDDEGAKGHKGRYGDKCDSCHGTKAWKPSNFAHDTDTKFALRGAHRSTACNDCHTGPLYQQKLPTDCNGCHARDDKHKGTLGTDCAACHTEKSWKERSRFDHDKTRFPLLGKHVQTRCEACHKSTNFKAAPRECVECHRAEDKHAGTLGTRCADCHGERDWKTTTGRFDHDKTRFRLRNKHAAPLACTACHADLKHMRDTPVACASCHTKHDKHEGQLGKDCERCHDDRSWKVPRFDHARTRFALLGRHLAVACKDCHATPRYRDAKSECFACHERDDKHKRAFGTRCESCHNARAWPLASFDHDKTAYRLDTTHRKLACESCHRQPAPPGKPAAAIGSSCIACHRKDDVHDGGLGVRCEQCHVSESWKKVQPLGARP